MIGIGHLLTDFWMGIATHLWQTTIVVLPLLILGGIMRNAPHKLTSTIAWLGLVKLLLPLSLLAPLCSGVIAPLLDRTGSIQRASGFLHPGVLINAANTPPAPWRAWLVVSLTLVWIASAIWFGVRLWRRRPGAIFRDSVSADSLPAHIRKRLESALEATGLPLADVRIASGQVTPAVFGLWHRKILIPMDVIMGLPKEELRAVLLHERAHVHRLDSVTDGFLAIVMAAFYFYPPLWLISRWLRESAEYACDQAAVQAGVATETYTHALARTLSLQLAAFSGPAALSSHRSSLRERFNRLDEPWRYVTMTKHRLILALSVACTIVISVAVVLFAKTSVDKPDGPTAPSTPGEVAQGYAAAPDTSSPPPASPERFDMDLDSMPEIIQATYVLPKYPEEAKKAGVEAKAMLDVFIKADGTVSYAEVAEEISGYPEFGTNAVEAVRQWKFKPAIVDGSPVAVWVKIPFAYTLDEKKTRLDAKEEAGPGAAAGAESQGESKSIEGELKAPVEGKGQKPAVSEREGEVVVESHVSPKYPEDAKKAGVEGRVLVEVEVLKDGTVGRATVKEGIEGYASLGKSAVEALSKWRFRPVLKDGKPIDTTVCVPVEFKLQDKGTPATK